MNDHTNIRNNKINITDIKNDFNKTDLTNMNVFECLIHNEINSDKKTQKTIFCF